MRMLNNGMGPPAEHFLGGGAEKNVCQKMSGRIPKHEEVMTCGTGDDK